MLLAWAIAWLQPGLAAAQGSLPWRSSSWDALCPVTQDVLDDAGDALDISADEAERTADGSYIFSGDVLLRRGRHQIASDKAIYEELERKLIFPGSFQWLQPGLRLDAGQGSALLADDGQPAGDELLQSAHVSGVRYELYGGRSRGEAQQLSLSDGIISLRQSSYSSCVSDTGPAAWNIKSDSIRIDRASGIAVAEDAVMRVFGVPVMYVPSLSFPVDGRRRSGLLPPRLRQSSHTGFDIAIPYYFNLAPDRDATFIARPTTRGGLLLGGEFRYLGDDGGSGSLGGEHVVAGSDDSRERGRLQVDVSSPGHDFMDHKLDFKAQIESVSDRRYFEDYGGDVLRPVLRQQLSLSSSGNEDFAFTLLADRWQSLRPLSAQAKPYRRLPQLNWRYGRDATKSTGFGVNGEYTYFDRDSGVTGSRLHLAPWLRWRWNGGGHSLQSTATVRATGYDLRDSAAADSSPRRVLPTLGLDHSRHLAWLQSAPGHGNGNFWHMLRWRTRYSYVPHRGQGHLPLFDTVPVSLSRSSLWYGQRYTGNDRIGDEHGITAGLEYDFSRFGQFSVDGRYSVAQRLLFNDPRVRLSEELDGGSLGRNLLVQELSVRPGMGPTDITAGWAHDNERGRSELYHFRLSWRPPEGDKFASLWHIYRRALREPTQSGLELRLPLGDNVAWSWYGNALVAWRGARDGLQSAAGGIEYKSCCWAVSVGLRRYRRGVGGGHATSWTLDVQIPALSASPGT